MKRYYLFLISIAIIAADQITKLIIRQTYPLHSSSSVIGDFFRITHITNSGAAFGLSLGSTAFNRIFFIAITFIAAVVLTILIIKTRDQVPRISFALILGGACGNLIDRIIYGGVTDFLDFDFPDFLITRWPAFNVADASIVIAIGILLIYTFFFEEKRQQGEQA